ncbi:hypothetical protein CN394_11125 [Bacillus anthracis]|nr:hypothetical protein CN394_11125 [Bacillus anthracis]PEZ79994.1 hypothetical protein CN410_02580 [Bacillus anthracis]
MSYIKFYAIANSMVEVNERLSQYAKYYANQKISGLHYTNFIPSSNTLSISKPNHSTHVNASNFLLYKKRNSIQINSLLVYEKDIKKFLDFLLIWNITDSDLINSDPFILLVGFTDYLRLIDKWEPKSDSIEWSLLTKIPLHDQALLIRKIIPIGYDQNNFLTKKNTALGVYPISSIKRIVKHALSYLDYIQKYTYQFENLKLQLVPTITTYTNNSIIAGTQGGRTEVSYHIDAILSEAEIDTVDAQGVIKPLCKSVFSKSELDIFTNAIPKDDVQNKLLFMVLAAFGLRRGEACNLKIDISTVPKEIYLMDHFKARECIKAHLKGDLEFHPQIERWVCSVQRIDYEHFDRKIKTKSRELPLVIDIISQEHFLQLLTDWIIKRSLIMDVLKIQHPFLFISISNNSKGSPITGGTIYSRFHKIVRNSKNINILSHYSPHTFRHFFATYLIRIQNENISDVSDWLGHQNLETTRTIYYHYLPSENSEETNNTVLDMKNIFKGGRDT